jgi:hypothetical protein
VRSETTKEGSVKQSGIQENMSTAEHREITRELITEVTPEMIEAGKLVLAPSNDQRKSLEHSIGEVYVAMAAEDHAAVGEQKQISETKRSNRIKIWLYSGTCAMLILAAGLLTKVVGLF